MSNYLNNNSIYSAFTTSAKQADNSSKVTPVKKVAPVDSNAAAIYVKSAEEPEKKATYSINKMSKEDRAAIAEQLKADQAYRQQQLTDIVSKTLTGQSKSFGIATGDEFWRMFADGKVTVDAAAKAKAQEDISEDGYWGVKQTSERLFDFASALAGDNVEMMEKMQKAMEKGFGQATKTWGKELPSISKDTYDAANKLFEDYYASKKEVEA
ncbi:MAG: hypothetical protein E7257_00095 [Lachnospiraceae bacterium]|nr:hypothetical protein [Lachnospiraceae bacterium]MBQ9936283.1 hypothetical protein [Lachnospiraceae bacterium]